MDSIRFVFKQFVLINFCFSFFCLGVQAHFEGLLPVAHAAAKEPKEEAKKVAKKLNKAKEKSKIKNQKKSKNQKKDPFYSSKYLDKIYLRMAKRQNRIIGFKKKGVVGEADNGLLKMRTTKGLSTKEKELLEKLVKVENSDRNKMFSKMEEGTQPTKLMKEETRRHYFETQLTSDGSGVYYFRADHWMKK